MIGLIILLFWVFMAIFSTSITQSYTAQDAMNSLQAPSAAHWFGTDDLGRDVFARTMAGARTVLIIAPLATVLALLWGSIIGLVTGFYRGLTDDIVMRGIDVLLALPIIITSILILSLFGKGTAIIIFTIGVLFTPVVSRTVRAAVIGEREREYVMAARLRGERSAFVMAREILPNITQPIIVEGTIRLGYAVFTAATLAFLGFGLAPPSPDWGLTIATERVFLQIAPVDRDVPGRRARLARRGHQPHHRRTREDVLQMSTTENPQPAGDAAALDVRDLEVTFHRRGRRLPVLKGVTLKIERGEAYGLVGESGCGKTTLAMAAMRYLAANGTLDNGRVLVDGQDVSELSEEALRKWRGGKVAMVYQDPTQALSPAMKIGAQLAEVYHYHEGLDKKAAWEKAREALRRVAMPDPDATLRRYPFELSGGQQQRVVIAMALAVNPQLLILDEPTTGLDATVEAEILDLIEELRGRINAAILLITHNLGLVVRLCERVGVLYAGRLVEEGPAKDVFTDPRHPYTMGLLRCVPRFGMNKTDAALQTIPGTLPALGDPLEGCVYSARCPMAQPVCKRREPDFFPWPGDDAVKGRAEAEAMPPDPAAYSPHHAEPVGVSDRHARCYFCAETPGMPHLDPGARDQPRGARRRPGRRARHRQRGPHVQGRTQAAHRRRRRLPQPAQGRDLRPGRRVGQRQDDAGQVRHRPASRPTPAPSPSRAACSSRRPASAPRTPCAPSRWCSRTRIPHSTPPGARVRSSRAQCASWAEPRRAPCAPRSTSSPPTCASSRVSCSRGRPSSPAGRSSASPSRAPSPATRTW